ncbi:hypothetical protein ILYODFUR_000439 [Ilyodon furcidens]|uniref:Uncharacterized protein n=1 Tax=Ilyodon furcidens TaxID=33524 RepID=A0ABV0UQW6_9TELE
MSLCGWECNSCPQDSILHGPVSLEVLFRQDGTCQAASHRASALEQMLKEKQSRYRCISSQYNAVDFSFICLQFICLAIFWQCQNIASSLHWHVRYEAAFVCLA